MGMAERVLAPERAPEGLEPEVEVGRENPEQLPLTGASPHSSSAGAAPPGGCDLSADGRLGWYMAFTEIARAGCGAAGHGQGPV